jgi:hypothetical protein
MPDARMLPSTGRALAKIHIRQFAYSNLFISCPVASLTRAPLMTHLSAFHSTLSNALDTRYILGHTLECASIYLFRLLLFFVCKITALKEATPYRVLSLNNATVFMHAEHKQQFLCINVNVALSVRFYNDHLVCSRTCITCSRVR